MKKLISLIMTAALILGLCACGAAAPAPAKTQSESPADGSGSVPASELPTPPEASTLPETPTAAQAVPALTGPAFAAAMEYDRLYAVDAQGHTALLKDDFTNVFVRQGETVTAAFRDGSIRRFDLAAGTEETLLQTPLNGIHRLWSYGGGLLFATFSMVQGMTYYLLPDGESSAREVLPEVYNTVTACGDVFLYTDYEEDILLRCYDPAADALRWTVPMENYPDLYAGSDGGYCLDRDALTLSRINAETGAMEPLALTLRETDASVLCDWNGVFLVEGDYRVNGQLTLVSAEGRRTVPLDNEGWSVTLADVRDGVALLRDTEYGPSAVAENNWWTRTEFWLLDMASGELTKVPAQGAYSALFAGGDFPVMDSSTARKPVTASVYGFFCENTGVGGSAPLCSTTHYAWLNMADRKADVALLAAPTEEEKAYLAEKGVDVEMKLYGGDGLVFIGNKACGVTDLTLEQVKAIYRGEITNWKQLGGADHPIRVLYRDDQSGSQRLFELMLWADEPLPDQEALGFERLDEMSTIVSQCLYDPYALGYSIMTYLNDVYSNEDLLCFTLGGVEAKSENVASNAYPLSTKGYVVIRADEPEGSPARRLYDWFGSPLSDYILTMNGVTPLHG